MSEERILKLVFDVVNRYGLMNRDRSRKKSYKRIYLCHFLRNEMPSLTLQEIADHVGYNAHDDVIYACKRHEKIKHTIEYKQNIKQIKTVFKYGVDSLGGVLKFEVLKAETIEDLKLIKAKIIDNVL